MLPSWLRDPADIPAGGIELNVTYRTGSQSAKHHIQGLNPVLAPLLGGSLFPGSLNFWAESSVALPSPHQVRIGADTWQLVPVVILESEVGIAARKDGSGAIPFIEVFAREKLSTKLGLVPNTTLQIRLLPGKFLGLAA